VFDNFTDKRLSRSSDVLQGANLLEKPLRGNSDFQRASECVFESHDTEDQVHEVEVGVDVDVDVDVESLTILLEFRVCDRRSL
jgi:hypothetical protein